MVYVCAIPLKIFEDFMVSSPSKERLVFHLQELIRERDPYIATEGHYYAQHYIQEQLKHWGQVNVVSFRHQGRDHYNFCLTLPGRQALAPIVIGAHYDTVPGSPGADDNATGVAVLLELARLFAERPPRRPVHLVAFDLEELGLLGSKAYVKTLQGKPVYLMLSLEMLGYCGQPGEQQIYPVKGMEHIYPKTSDFIALIGNWQTIPVMERLRRSLGAADVNCAWLPMVNRGRPLPMTRRSDHASFWDAGYNALMVTDTADLRNPHYHARTDTLNTLNLDFLTGVCLGLFEALTGV